MIIELLKVGLFQDLSFHSDIFVGFIYYFLQKMKYIKHFHYMCLTKTSREILIEFANVTRNKKQTKITAIYLCIWMFLFQKIRQISNHFVKHKF